MMHSHNSDSFGMPRPEPIERDPDEQLEQMRDEAEIQDAIDLTISPLQMILLAEYSDQIEGAA